MDQAGPITSPTFLDEALAVQVAVHQGREHHLSVSPFDFPVDDVRAADERWPAAGAAYGERPCFSELDLEGGHE